MDFLNRAFAQLNDLFQSMTPGARITSALLLLVVVISTGYLFTYQASGPDSFLMAGRAFSPSELKAMLPAFGKAGLGDYDVVGSQIRISRGKQAAYMAALVDANALPRNFQDHFVEALKANSGPFTSGRQSADQLLIATQQELGLIISAMPDVEEASVIYNKPPKAGFREKEIHRASVNVMPRGNHLLAEQQVKSIRHLVAGAFAKLEPSGVTVTDLKAPYTWPAGDPESGFMAAENELLQLTRLREQELKDKIKKLLGYLGSFQVAVTAELDPTRSSVSEKLSLENKGFTVGSSSTEIERKSDSSTPGGRPGLNSQGTAGGTNTPASLAGGGGRSTSETESETATETISLPQGEKTRTETAGYTLKRATVSIVIPQTYLANIWKESNPPDPANPQATPAEPTQADLDKIGQDEETRIKRQVARLLPTDPTLADPLEPVDVSFSPTAAIEPIPTASMSENALVWFGQSWPTLGTLALGVFGLLMLRSMLNAKPTPPPGAQFAIHSGEDGEDDESAEEAAVRRLGRFSGTGASLRDELSELVDEDTEAAANILKAWIGHVG